MIALPRWRTPLGTVLLGCLWACGGDRPASAAEAGTSGAGTAGSDERASVVDAQPWPSDPCGWIPVPAVESIVGPLAGVPRRHEGGCLYPLPLDAETKRRRALAARMDSAAVKMAKQLGQEYTPMVDRRPTEPAVVIDVRLTAETAGERGLAAGEEVAAGWAGASIDTAAAGKAARAGGWDFSRSPIAIALPGFLGRAGQLSVSTMLQATPPVTDEMLARLAARVRDGIPDGPFRPSDAREGSSGAKARGPDPCSLLTRAEAEAVLGPLTQPPYRTAKDSPYPDPAGTTCAYRTRAHRVLGLTPYWSGGAMEAELARGGGGLISMVAPGLSPETADTIEGPWEEALADPAGPLIFRAGDHAIAVAYLTSSTGAAGAVELARGAAGRLFVRER
ncbi:MAG TPA: hypothetical protein VMN37_05285 [Gemmatimonadales bacterium]|nr:hypothetical protein [Gemmatimonadales bacterium]